MRPHPRAGRAPLVGFVVIAKDPEDGREVVIGESFPEPYRVAVSEPNAKLMAAAPDLLLACQDAYAALTLASRGPLTPAVASFAVDSVESAINKATQ
jgi:hypothetical protein